MKNTKFLFSVIALLLAILLIGCASTSIKDEFYVSPDPVNPFQGTWLFTSSL